jgi:hypothetical protein
LPRYRCSSGRRSRARPASERLAVRRTGGTGAHRELELDLDLRRITSTRVARAARGIALTVW